MVNPFVFQCSRCNQIFGDSSSWYLSIPALSAYTLTDYSTDTLRIKDTLSTVTLRQEAEDSGSTYNELICTGCSTVIGRVYRSTPYNLDHLRGKYTFLTTKTKCYELGNLDKIPQSVDGEIIQATRPDPNEVSKRIGVLEAIVLYLNKRMETVEGNK